MNPRVGIAVLLVALVVAGALVLRPSAPTNAIANAPATSKPPELVVDKAMLAAAKKAAEASTKQAAAVQASANKVAAEVQPVLQGYSFLTNESELILSYTVKFAAALAKNWKIKELEAYSPKKVTIEFFGGKERIKATRSFDPSGKPL
jgi:hypothetical protein